MDRGGVLATGTPGITVGEDECAPMWPSAVSTKRSRAEGGHLQ